MDPERYEIQLTWYACLAYPGNALCVEFLSISSDAYSYQDEIYER